MSNKHPVEADAASPWTSSVRSKPSGLRQLAKTHLGRFSLCAAAQPHTRKLTSTLTVFYMHMEQAFP